MSRAGIEKSGEPLRGIERLEWARVALEDAVGRMVKNPGEQIFIIAAMSRYRELENIRIPVEQLVAAKQREGEPPIEARMCPHCLRGVATVMQHYTGTHYICDKRNGPPAPRIGRPPNVDPSELADAVERLKAR